MSALPNHYDRVASDMLPLGYYDEDDGTNSNTGNNVAGIVDNNANAPSNTNGDDSDSDEYDDIDWATGKPKTCDVTIRAGDAIHYYNPTMVAGDPFAFRNTVVIGVHPQEEVKLALMNGEVLPESHKVKKTHYMAEDVSGLVECAKPTYWPLEDHHLQASGSGTLADGVLNTAAQITDVFNRHKENMRANSAANGFAPMDAVASLRGGKHIAVPKLIGGQPAAAGEGSHAESSGTDTAADVNDKESRANNDINGSDNGSDDNNGNNDNDGNNNGSNNNGNGNGNGNNNANNNGNNNNAAEGGGDANEPRNAVSLQEYIEDDIKVQPSKRTTYILMLAYQNVVDFDPTSTLPYTEFINRTGYKRIFKYSKLMIVQEMRRRNPSAKPNASNKTIEQLLGELAPLENEIDKEYIITKEKEYRNTLLLQLRNDAEEEENNAPAARMTPIDRQRFACMFEDEEIFAAYMLSQNCLTRVELDAGQSGAGNMFREMAVEKLNADEWAPRRPGLPNLHSDFGEPVTLERGDFVWTTDKVKRYLNDVRRNLTKLIIDYERSGNGSNQAAVAESESGNGEETDANWGRFNEARARRMAGEGDTIDGDDRKAFLKHLHVDYLYTWHVFDKHNLVRFTCNRLSNANSASSHTTPRPTSRGSNSRSTPQSNEQLVQSHQEMVGTVRKIGDTIAEMMRDNAEMGRAAKMRRIDELRARRYQAAIASAGAPSGSREEAVHETWIGELTNQISESEADLRANENAMGAGVSNDSANNAIAANDATNSANASGNMVAESAN